MTYPNGRVLNDNYGTSNSMPDATSRIASLIDNDGTTHLADYSYLGLGAIIDVTESQPALDYTLVGTAGGNDPDTGDIYRGLDRFGRVKDLLWQNTSTNTAAVRIQHGYDRAGNRLWRADLVAEAASAGFDELYSYDGLDRLANLQRGTLNSGDTGITTPKFGQCWTLDATGNWKGFREDDSGSGTWDLVQSRTANTVNEITAISNSTGPAWNIPAYDGNGNMTTIPQPESPTMVFLGTYDAWNRLVKLVDAIGDTIEQYAYDGLRRRTMKQNPGAAETREYYYSSGWQVLEERVGGSTNAERQFTWGLRYIDDLILRDRDTNGDGTLDERMFALQDPNWNVVGLTDSSGNMQERYSYDAYGLPTVLTATYGSRSSSSYAWETLYAGYRYDAATGLYLARNRVLNPRTGTWGQRDPGGYVDGLDFYEYAIGNPLTRNDAFGLDSPSRASLMCGRRPANPGTAGAWQPSQQDIDRANRWYRNSVGFNDGPSMRAVSSEDALAAQRDYDIQLRMQNDQTGAVAYAESIRDLYNRGGPIFFAPGGLMETGLNAVSPVSGANYAGQPMGQVDTSWGSPTQSVARARYSGPFSPLARPAPTFVGELRMSPAAAEQYVAQLRGPGAQLGSGMPGRGGIPTGIGRGAGRMRYPDVRLPTGADEVKTGNVGFVASLCTQMQKDAWIIQNRSRGIETYNWNFLPNERGQIGVDPRVFDMLQQNNINWQIHMWGNPP